MTKLSLGSKVRKARLDLEITQEEASGSFITRNMLSKIESDVASPSLKTIQYLAERLNKPISYFLSNDWDDKLDMEDDIKLYFEHSNFLLKNKEYKSCISYIEQILKTIDKENKNIYYGRLLYTLAKSYIKIGDYTLVVEKLIDESIYLLEINNDLYYLAQAYFYKSNIFFHKEKFEKAEKYILKSLELLERSYVDDTVLQIKLYFSYAFILYKLKRYEESKNILDKVLLESKESRCFFNYGDTYMLLGNVYEKIRQFENAIHYTKKAVLVYRSLDELEAETDCKKNIGNYYLQIKDFDNASKFLNEALLSYEKLNNIQDTNTVKSDIHELLVKKKDYKEAIKYSEEINIEGLSLVDKARVYINSGNSYAGIKDYAKADESFKIAELLLKKSDRHDILKMLYESYKNMYSSVKDFEKAYIYSEKSKQEVLALESK